MGVKVDKVQLAMQTRREPISLESPVGDESNARLIDFIEDSRAANPDQSLLDKRGAEETHELLRVLTPREQQVHPDALRVRRRQRAHARSRSGRRSR